MSIQIPITRSILDTNVAVPTVSYQVLPMNTGQHHVWFRELLHFHPLQLLQSLMNQQEVPQNLQLQVAPMTWIALDATKLALMGGAIVRWAISLRMVHVRHIALMKTSARLAIPTIAIVLPHVRTQREVIDASVRRVGQIRVIL